jgi:3-hydroxy-9,10-secoandrosta-1,3,5(10)-triene-9,17-dione monooxygenase
MSPRPTRWSRVTASPMPRSEGSALPTPRETLLERARALAPVLAERAADCEAARCVPADSVAAFKQAGLIRMTQPARFGGAEQGWDVLCETSHILAAGDGAQAWIAAIMADHAQMLGCFPVQAQDDVWGDDPDAVMSASFDPVGKAVPVDGGWRMSGLHNFSSGVDHADWVICGGFIIDGDKRDGPHFFLIPRGDGEILDDWDTVGLEGTGSKSFRTEDVFVPEHRRLDGAMARAGTPPGAEINTAPVYRLSRGGLTSALFSALSVGMAQGLLEEWLAYTKARVSHGTKLAEDPGTRFIAGQASAELAAAEALYLNAVRGGMDILATGRTMTVAELVIAKRDFAWSAQIAVGAGTRLFNAAGGRAIFSKSPLQRRYRNLMAAASHFSITWDRAAVGAGAQLLS